MPMSRKQISKAGGRPKNQPESKFKRDLNGHAWMVMAAFGMTYEEALESHRPDNKLTFGAKDVLSLTPAVCYFCEEAFVAVHNRPCTGDPTDARVAADMKLEADALRRTNDE